MLEVREDQLEAMRDGVRQALPEMLTRRLGEEGHTAEHQRRERVVSARDRRGFVTQLTFDERGLPARLRLPSGSHYDLAVDDDGRVGAVAHSGGAEVALGRDEAGRITTVAARCNPARDDARSHVGADDGVQRWQLGYGPRGHLASLTRPDNRSTTFSHDDQGRLTSIETPSGATRRWTRNAEGRLEAHTDALGRETRFVYEGGGLAGILYPDGTNEAMRYDAAGRRAAWTMRDGRHLVHQLDERGALRRTDWQDGTWVAYDLTPEGRLAAARNAEGELSFELDPRGDVLAEQTPQGTARMAYDVEGRLVSLTTPFGDTVRYDYDPDGRLTTVTDWEGREQRIAYADDGTVAGMRYGNGLTERQRHTHGGRLAHAKVVDGRGQVRCEQRYDYDLCDRLVEARDLDDDGWTERFEYDADGRLSAYLDASVGSRHDFGYDAQGNLVRDGETDVDVGEMDEVRRRGDDVIHHDALGRIVRFNGPRGDTELIYDQAGHLREARVAGERWRYGYDALGRRILKTDGTQSWRFGWAGQQLVWEEYQASPDHVARRRDYLVVPDAVVPLAFREGGRTFWLQADARGAIVRAFDEDGATVWQARYDAFGRAEASAARLRQPFRLPGQYHDEETGLHHCLARYYAPSLRSFVARDPLWHRVGATNYSYAGNDPYNRADPFGGFAFILGAVAAVAVGAAVGAAVAWATGGDPVAGAIEGGMATAGAIVGGLLGGPVGLVAGGMVGNVAGAFTGSLVEQARNGDPLCMGCAARTAAVAAAIDVALLGLGKIPGVKRAVRAIGDKLHRASEPMRDWVAKKADDLWRRVRPKPPERPLLTPDGKPQQRKDSLDELYDDAAVAQAELGDATRNIAAETNGSPIVPDKLKGRPRAEEKIRTDYDGDPSRIVDLSRSSIEYENMDDLYKGKAMIEEQFNVVRTKDRFDKPAPGGYRDMMMNVEMSNGHIVEVQLHSKQVLEVKNGPGHDLYEQVRTIEADAAGRALTPDEATKLADLNGQMEKLYGDAFDSFMSGGGG